MADVANGNGTKRLAGVMQWIIAPLFTLFVTVGTTALVTLQYVSSRYATTEYVMIEVARREKLAELLQEVVNELVALRTDFKAEFRMATERREELINDIRGLDDDVKQNTEFRIREEGPKKERTSP